MIFSPTSIVYTMRELAKYLLVTVCIVLFMWVVFSPSTENFDSVSDKISQPLPAIPASAQQSTDTRLTPADQIVPMIYEPNKGIITMASQFIGMPKIIPAWTEDINDDPKSDISNKQKVDRLSGTLGDGLMNNMCSPSCCSPQYPPPFASPQDKYVCDSKDEFVPSSYSCNNGVQNTGCLCLTKDQSNFLADRGGNGSDSGIRG